MALTGLSEDALIKIAADIPIFEAAISPGLAADWIADEDAAPTTYIMPASVVWGGIKVPEYIFFPSVSSATAVAATLPVTADPPFPPVWPYKFATNEIYGREHMNQILRMTRGDRYSFTANVIINGDPFVLTNYAVSFTAKWEFDDLDAAAVISLTEGNGVTVTDPTGGVVNIIIPPSATRNLPDRTVTLVYDIQATNGAAEVYTLLQGHLVVRPDVRIATT
jgi:hypothetical protein